MFEKSKKQVIVLQLKNTLICAYSITEEITLARLWREERISETSSVATVNVLGGKYAYNTVKQINELAQIPSVIIYITGGSQTHISNWVARTNKISIEQFVMESGLFMSRKNIMNWQCLAKEDQVRYKSHKLGDIALLKYICDKEEISPRQLHYVGNTGLKSSERLGFGVHQVDSPIELSWSLNKLLRQLGGDMLPVSKQSMFRPKRSYVSGSRKLAPRQPLLKDTPRHGLTVYGTGRTY